MAPETDTTLRALGSGMAGALVTTLIHEAAQRRIPTAPRLDTLGRRAIAGAMRRMNLKPPSGERLQHWALAGDLVFNSTYLPSLQVIHLLIPLFRNSLTIGAGEGSCSR